MLVILFAFAGYYLLLFAVLPVCINSVNVRLHDLLRFESRSGRPLKIDKFTFWTHRDRKQSFDVAWMFGTALLLALYAAMSGSAEK
jgi:hypothetical protein